MTPEEKLAEGVKGAMNSPCLICGAAPKVAYALPIVSEDDSTTLHFYSLCSTCSSKPDVEEASRKIVMVRKGINRSGLN